MSVFRHSFAPFLNSSYFCLPSNRQCSPKSIFPCQNCSFPGIVGGPSSLRHLFLSLSPSKRPQILLLRALLKSPSGCCPSLSPHDKLRTFSVVLPTFSISEGLIPWLMYGRAWSPISAAPYQILSPLSDLLFPEPFFLYRKDSSVSLVIRWTLSLSFILWRLNWLVLMFFFYKATCVRNMCKTTSLSQLTSKVELKFIRRSIMWKERGSYIKNKYTKKLVWQCYDQYLSSIRYWILVNKCTWLQFQSLNNFNSKVTLTEFIFLLNQLCSNIIPHSSPCMLRALLPLTVLQFAMLGRRGINISLQGLGCCAESIDLLIELANGRSCWRSAAWIASVSLQFSLIDYLVDCPLICNIALL